MLTACGRPQGGRGPAHVDRGVDYVRSQKNSIS